VMHGKTSHISHGGRDIFAGLPDPMQVMRYHSLIVDAESLPAELLVLAHDVDDPTEIHAVRHKEHPVWGVQFHPESIMTPDGKQLLRNFLELAL
jgi:anthranilate synthase component 2